MSIAHEANSWVMAWRTGPTNVPKHLSELHSKLKVLFLPERRYPRHVKIKMSNFPRNRGKRTPKADGTAK